MGLATFTGGIHPFEGKALSENQPMEILMPRGDLVYPLSQHIGAPAKPLVKKGDPVLVGQKIAEAGGFVSAPVIASVSGTVKAVQKHLTAGGSMVDSIIVENDGKYEKTEGFGRERELESLSRDEILACIREAGIVGLGGAGFPTHVKLAPKDPGKIDYVIINGAECEPYLTSDYRRMIEEPEKVVGGLRVILKLFDGARGVIGIEDNKPEAIKKMTELVKDDPRIEVCPLKTKYPQGGERVLIYAVTGRKINSSMLPADVGCIVDNVDTAAAVYMAVVRGEPLITKTVTVTGDAVAKPKNLVVRLGTCYQELIDAAGGFASEPEKIISGGPMMGQAMFDLQVPVAKNSSSLTCLTHDEAAAMEPTACIRCGRCVSVCPGRVVPQKLYRAALKHDLDLFVKLNGMECCECGCCSFVCPAGKPLTQSFKEMRKAVAAARRK